MDPVDTPKNLSTVLAKARAVTNERFIDWIVRPERVKESIIAMAVLSLLYVIFFVDIEVSVRKEARDVRPFIQPKYMSIAFATVLVLVSGFAFVKASRY